MKYRKKPVVIEAFKYNGDLMNSKGKYYVPDWAVRAYEDGIMFYKDINVSPAELFINTLDGDYVIQGVKGELYPCKQIYLNKLMI